MKLFSWIRNQWDRAAAWALITVAAVVLVIGWFGVTSTVYPAEQISYVVSAGLGGIFLLGLGAVMWLSADIQDEWRQMKAIEDQLARIAGE